MKNVSCRIARRAAMVASIFLFLNCLGSPSSLFAMGDRPKTFQVEVRVDFGPAGRPLREEKLEVEKGTTPKEAVSQMFPVLSGKACCSFRELIAIDGVAIDPAKNRWWTCSVNGSKKNISPQKTKLKARDIVEWKYTEDKQ